MDELDNSDYIDYINQNSGKQNFDYFNQNFRLNYKTLIRSFTISI